MPKRTTLVLDDRVYEKLVRESLSRYGSARKISKIVNELVEESSGERGDILKLIYTEKMKKTSAREFEHFRSKLSARLEH